MPVDITEKVRELCRDYPLNENMAAGFKAPQSHRIMSKNMPLNGSKKAYYGHSKAQDKPERLKVKVHGRDGFFHWKTGSGSAICGTADRQ